MGSSIAERRLRVAVLAGGDSPEREVSLRSGAAVARALAEAGYDAIAIDPAGRRLADIDWTSLDACFIALHGGAGEDGRVQEELELLGVPYTGSSPRACRLAMSKSNSKQRFAERGVPTLPCVVLNAGRPIAEEHARVSSLGYPLVVKPDGQGSSLGVTVVGDATGLRAAVEAAAAFGSVAIAEPQVLGREFTIAVLGERALPIIEIVTPEGVFSYEAKYANSLTEYRLDGPLAAPVRAALVDASVGAAAALGTRGLVRVDLMVDGDGRAWVLEVNTIPGMTEQSLAPLAAKRAGLSMPALCDRLVRDCLTTAGVA